MGLKQLMSKKSWNSHQQSKLKILPQQVKVGNAVFLKKDIPWLKRQKLWKYFIQQLKLKSSDSQVYNERQNLQWNVPNEQLQDWSIVLEKITQSVVFNIYGAPLKSIQHINFDCLMELSLFDIGLTNIEGLSFINLQNVTRLCIGFAQQQEGFETNIRTIKSMKKCRLKSIRQLLLSGSGSILDMENISRILCTSRQLIQLELQDLEYEDRAVRGYDLRYLAKIKSRVNHISRLEDTDFRIQNKLVNRIFQRKAEKSLRKKLGTDVFVRYIDEQEEEEQVEEVPQ